MPTQNLINLERALLNCNGAGSSDNRIIDALIGACSDAIRKWCRRDFDAQSYDELYDGNGDRRLLLRQYPILSVEAVRYRQVTALKIQNTNQLLNQQARVQVMSTGLKLTRFSSGVRSEDTSVTWTSNVTINAVVAAVNALGNGWEAQIVGDVGSVGGFGDYGLWPSQDLYIPPSYGSGTQSQGAMTARGVFAELKLHTYELQGYQWDPRGWLLRAIPYTDPELLHPEDLVWPVGINNFRIQYTAGYTVIPESVQEACAEWVSALWNATKRDPALRSQAPSGGTAQAWAGVGGSGDTMNPPANIIQLLAPYRRYTVGTNQG